MVDVWGMLGALLSKVPLILRALMRIPVFFFDLVKTNGVFSRKSFVVVLLFMTVIGGSILAGMIGLALGAVAVFFVVAVIFVVVVSVFGVIAGGIGIIVVCVGMWMSNMVDDDAIDIDFENMLKPEPRVVLESEENAENERNVVL